MFSFFIENKLISSNQPGFKSRDFSFYQLWSITFRFEVRGIFLDVLKVFDKVWHKVIIFKLKQNGVSSKLLSVYFIWPFQRQEAESSLNGQVSSWTGANAEVSQWLILGPLLVLVYINDLADGLSSNADTKSLFSVIQTMFTLLLIN